MTDLALDVLAIAGANAVVATLLVVVAWLLQRRGHHRVAHTLCVLALVKLITPPLVRLPVLPATAATAVSAEALVQAAMAELDAELDAGGELAAPADLVATDPAAPLWPLGAVAATLLGSLLLFVRAGTRSTRFRRILRLAGKASAPLTARARALAQHMQLDRCPDVLVVPARISPMLCVFDQRAHVVLPQDLLASASPAQIDALLAHELAHASRRDHWVRALEVLATGLYWWLPTTWLLRRTLRTAEERACDEHVLAALPGQGRAYADALLATLDFLAGSARAMPPVACGAGAFHDLKTRLTTIMSDSPRKTLPWTLRATLLAGAAAVLPIAPTLAQDEGNDKARAELRAAMAEIKELRAELDAMRADMRKARATAEPFASGPTGWHRKELDQATLHEMLAKIKDQQHHVSQEAHEHVQKALAAARERMAEVDVAKLHEHLAKIGETVDGHVHEHVHKALAEAKKVDFAKLHEELSRVGHEVDTTVREQVQKALAQVHEHAKHIDHDELRKHIEHSVRHATEAAREAMESVREAEGPARDAERDAVRKAVETTRRAERDAASDQRRELVRRERAEAEEAVEADDDARKERRAVIERLRAKEAKAEDSEAASKEIAELRDQVKMLQQRIEEMTRKAEATTRARRAQ